jgi:hypothetical protein
VRIVQATVTDALIGDGQEIDGRVVRGIIADAGTMATAG